MSAKKLLQTFGIILILSYGVFAQEWSWKPFKPASQPWTILAPGPMVPDEEAKNSNGSKGSYAYNDPNGFFAVIYRDTPRRWLPWKADYSGYISDVRDDVVKANRGELLKEGEFSNRNITGREAYVKFPTGMTRGIEGQAIMKYRVQRFRMFFIGKRFYVVLAVMNENEINTPAIDRYFNSFAYNSPPVAGADSYAVDEDKVLTVNASRGVLANDKDSEGDKLTVSTRLLTSPTNGTLTLNPDGSLSYTPAPNFYGRDTFTYAANDGFLDSGTATVTLTVNPVNDAPTLSNVPPTATIDELTALGFTPTANDIDTPVGSLKFSLNGAPAGASINPTTGGFSWTPTEAQGAGNYSFSIALSDGLATVSMPISVTVKEVNVAPVFSNIQASSTINELTAFSLNAQAVDPDIPVQSLTYSLIGAPSGASINPSTGNITWSPTEEQGNNSTYRFRVQASDGIATAETELNLTVKEVNSAPILSAIADQTIDELKPLSISTNGSDADLPANNLTYSLDPSNAPSGMSIDPRTGVISWTPGEAQGAGEYSVSVRLTDDGSPSLSDTKTFKVRVNEVNAAPLLAPIGNKTVDEETLLTFKVAATDSDLPANTLNYSLTNAPSGAGINPSTGVFSWTPTEAQGAGSFNVTIRVTDNGTPALSAEETITITVNEVNKAPVAESATVTTAEDAAVSISLKAADADLPQNTLTYSVVSAPANGKLSGTSSNLSYVPNRDFNGQDSFTFRVNDGSLNSNTATVQINITPVNDNPAAVADRAATTEGAAVTINVIANDTDIDGDRIVVTGVSNAVNGKVEINGSEIRFTPNPQFYGTGSFNYTISDGKGGTATALVTVTVNQQQK